MSKMDLTLAETFSEAYTFFNKALFNNELPACVIVVHRKRGARGYFWQDQWAMRNADGDVNHEERRHEIAMNPETFIDRNDKDIMSTLVHEMVHLQQQEQGKPSNSGHNKEWGRMMSDVGLMAYAAGYYPTKDDNGQWVAPKKSTGRKVSHVIIDGGAFDTACDELLSGGMFIPWTLTPPSDEEKALARKKRKSKTKFTCPDCGTNIWGKPGLNVDCGECCVPFEEQD